MMTGAVLVLLGYGGLSWSYAHPSLKGNSLLPAILNLMTGIGNSGAMTAAMNAQAKSFVGPQRGSATAMVLAGFGLSAFMYSTLSHEFFPGNTEDYLLLLALGSSLSFLAGIALVKIMPPAAASPEETDVDGPPDDPEVATAARPIGGRRRTSSDLSASAFVVSDDEGEHREDDAEERRQLLSRDEGGQRKPHRSHAAVEETDITGWKLLAHHDFQFLFLIMCLISGSGLLLINNVGTITRTLWDYNHAQPEPLDEGVSTRWWTRAAKATLEAVAHNAVGKQHEHHPHPNAAIQQEQAHQVSAISLGNASGRLAVGFLSDLFVSYVGSAKQRVWFLLPVTLLAFSSQFVFALPDTINSVRRLLGASLVTGFMYGSLFGLAPCLVFEIWGLKYAALNWGLTSLAPVISGNIFNLVFGAIFDRHVPSSSPAHQSREYCHCALTARLCKFRSANIDTYNCSPTPFDDPAEGEECYRTAFKFTSTATALSVFAAVVLILRRAGLSAWRTTRRDQ